ncbi:hypothetical protein [Variovorax sp. WS11]|uniref:hypothetical protein n=1 Tax=Variovorax sp. WS11 TaxID=1105204 RepID=UPI001EF2C6D8|nr:hypothetical protein [Variovorax sp. WS11]
MPWIVMHMMGRHELLKQYPENRVGCWGITEPDHGSDILDFGRQAAHPGSSYGKPNCIVRLEGDELVIQGQKSAPGYRTVRSPSCAACMRRWTTARARPRNDLVFAQTDPQEIHMSTNYQVVVYGASGYTGKLTAWKLAERGIPFIAAGRNAERLQMELAKVGNDGSRPAQDIHPFALGQPAAPIPKQFARIGQGTLDVGCIRERRQADDRVVERGTDGQHSGHDAPAAWPACRPRSALRR